MTLKKIGNLQIESEANEMGALPTMIKKIGVMLMFLIFLGAISGLFGWGMLGKAEKQNNDLKIIYDRFGRNQSTAIINFVIKNNTASSLRLSINQKFLKNIFVKKFIPKATLEEIDHENVIYHFQATHDTKTFEIKMIYEPEVTGKLSAEVGIPTKENIQFYQFIYP